MISSHQRQKIVKKRHFSFLKCLFLWLFSLSTPLKATDHCLSSEQQLAEVDSWGVVAKVIDGDTVHLQDGRKIRFIGINTPEIGRRGKASQPYAQKARRFLNQLLQKNKKIALSYDKDKKDRYKRVLAYVSLSDGRSIEQLMLTQGLAYSIVLPPNDRHTSCYREIEENARKAKKGLWTLAENQWLDTHELPKKKHAYRLIQGRINAYKETRKSIYLSLSKQLSIRIAKKDRQNFSHLKLKSLVGKKVQVRGWLNRYKGRQLLILRTAYNIKPIL